MMILMHDDPMAVDNSNSEDEDGDTTESELKFVASPGWIQKFMSRHNFGRFKMKGEKEVLIMKQLSPR